jgi:hypothetical protein
MTRETQSKLLGEFYAEKKNILKLKGEDYANEDVLSNFKTAGANIGISAEQQCLSLIATKVARLGNLLSGKTPNNESVSDSILDLSNYTDLLYCLVNEEYLMTNIDDFPTNLSPKEVLEKFYKQPLEFKVSKPQTKRWENVKPKGIINQINWSGVNEPITEPYEPKAGDVLIYNTLVYKWEIVYLDDNTVRLNAMGDLLITQRISRELFLEYIKESVLKKIN